MTLTEVRISNYIMTLLSQKSFILVCRSLISCRHTFWKLNQMKAKFIFLEILIQMLVLRKITQKNLVFQMEALELAQKITKYCRIVNYLIFAFSVRYITYLILIELNLFPFICLWSRSRNTTYLFCYLYTCRKLYKIHRKMENSSNKR